MWITYEFLFLIGLVFYLPRALCRRRLPHAGWSMRLGRYPNALIEKLRGRNTLWVHAVSVGEVLAVRPLVRALAQSSPDRPLVLSTTTPGGFEVASKSLPDGGVSIFVPLDLRRCVTAALKVVRPSILLLIESELWPVLIRETKRRGVPVVLVNGRISGRAFSRYRLVKRLAARLLDQIDLFLMQSQADADRILALGAPSSRVVVTGSLKWDASLGARPTPQAIKETATHLGLNGHEAIIVAGSTHRGEEDVLLEAIRTLRSAGAVRQQIRLILAPRHLERLAEVEMLVRQHGFTGLRLSQPLASGGSWEVGLVDTFGQLPRYYSLAAVVFIGGSLIPHGGQNPLEASSLGKPVIFGPSMHNFTEIAEQLVAHGAGRQVSGKETLRSTLEELLTNTTLADEMGKRARALTESSQGAVQRTLEALKPLLSRTAFQINIRNA